MKPLLSVKSLSKTFPNGVRALHNVSFDVFPNEFLVIIGLSGSGKTTLLRCINGLTSPTDGTIEHNGVPIQGVQRSIGMVFQQFNLVPRLSALDNVLTGQLGRTGTWKSLLHLYSAQDIEQARQCLEVVGLADKASLRADQLSGGQQQRIAIARALHQQPELLLADEPVASLDPATSHSIMDHLRRAHRERGLTVICNLHFLSLVREYATRVLALKAGEIVFEGQPTQIDKAWFKRIYGEDARDIHVF